MPVFVFVAAPIAAAVLELGLARMRVAALPAWLKNAVAGAMNPAEEFGDVDRQWRLHWVSAAICVFLGIAFFAADPAGKVRTEYDTKLYPVAAVNELNRTLSEAVFTEDEWGDYLIYRLYPNCKVFVDGRFDLYGGKFTESYLQVLNSNHTWQATLGKYGVTTVLLSVKTPLVGTLKESSRWRVVYDDGVAIVFRLRQSATSGDSIVSLDSRSPRDTSTEQDRVAISRNPQSLTERR
jgi:hypothetical protein